MNRRIVLYRDEEGWWVVTCHSLPGCNTQGETREEAITNMREAIELYLEVLEESGRPVPRDNQ